MSARQMRDVEVPQFSALPWSLPVLDALGLNARRALILDLVI
jgi:hypothetical protein